MPFAASFADSKTRVKRGADGKSVFAERLRATNLEQGAVVDPARGAVVDPARGAVVHLARGAVLHLARDRGTAPLGTEVLPRSGGRYTLTRVGYTHQPE